MMGITFGDHLIDSGYHDITPEQEREIEAREECARRGLDPDDDAADGVLVWMAVDQDMRERRNAVIQKCHACNGTGLVEGTMVGCAVCEGKTTLGILAALPPDAGDRG